MSPWSLFLFQVVNGLTFGGLLFVLASGFTLIFGLMRIVNMAHGAWYILGAYLAYSVMRHQGGWVAATAAATAGIGAMALVSHVIVRRVQGDMPQTLLTLGIGTVVADLALAVWGGNPKSISAPAAIGRPLTVAGFTYPSYRYFVLAVAILMGLSLWYLTGSGRNLAASYALAWTTVIWCPRSASTSTGRSRRPSFSAGSSPASPGRSAALSWASGPGPTLTS